MPSSQEWRALLATVGTAASNGAEAGLVRRALALGHDVAPGLVGCSLTELNGAVYRTPAASTDLAFDLDQAQYLAAAGPCVNAARDRQRYHLADLKNESRFPGFVAAALHLGVRSSLSVPVDGQQHLTALNLYSTVESAFATDRARATADFLARTIAALSARPASADRSTSAATSETEARKLGDRVTAAVDQVMRENALDQAGAFSVLTRRSKDRQASMRTVVDDVLNDDRGEP